MREDNQTDNDVVVQEAHPSAEADHDSSQSELTDEHQPETTLKDKDKVVNGVKAEVNGNGHLSHATPNGKQPFTLSKKQHEVYKQLLDSFAACDRCSFFLAGYRVLHGVEHLQEIAANSKHSWVELDCSPATRQLFNKSYGQMLENDWDYYECSCRRCQRSFTYQRADTNSKSLTFRVQITPRRR